jgi:hypothetical protein
LPTAAYFPLAIAVAAWITGVVDASLAVKSTGPKQTASKPTPPVNLPFD